MSSILFTWYSEYLTKEALEGAGNFKIEQVIRTVIYVYGLVLLAKDGTEPQGMIDRLIKNGRCSGVKMNMGGGGKGNGNLEATIPNKNCSKKKNWRMWNIFPIWII